MKKNNKYIVYCGKEDGTIEEIEQEGFDAKFVYKPTTFRSLQVIYPNDGSFEGLNFINSEDGIAELTPCDCKDQE